MAGFITFSTGPPEKEWSSSNWVFVGFLDHAIGVLYEDEEAVHELTSCKFNQSVDLGDIAEESPEMHKRILLAFRASCTQIASGDFPVSVDGKVLDEESQLQYRDAVNRLSELF